MPQTPTFDPAAVWQEWVSGWEKQINELSATISSREEFAETLNQAAKINFSARRAFDDAMEKLVQGFHVASQAQMQTILDRLDGIEERLDRIAATVEREKRPGASKPPEPRRTRKPGNGQ